MRITEEPNDILTIKPFDHQNKKSIELHPDLPQPPFTTLLVGPKGSGKSSVIVRMLYGNRKSKKCKPDNTHYKMYRHFFNKIYIFSPTWALDTEKTKRCRIPDDQIFEDVEMYDEILQEIVEQQTEDIKEDGKENADHLLLVFTDLAGSKMYSNRKGVINRIAYNHRHLLISSIHDTQALRQINPGFRSNLSGVMIFSGITNRLELKKVQDEFLGEYTDKEARQILKYVAEGSAYNFLYINMQQKGQLYKNFNRLSINSKLAD